VRRKPAAPVFQITQAELHDYRTLQEQSKVLADQLAQRRKSLLERMEARESEEPGSLRAQLTLREVRRFSADEVARIKGQAMADEIRAQLRPTTEKHFSVIQVTH
jgi:hypothetical protein